MYLFVILHFVLATSSACVLHEAWDIDQCLEESLTRPLSEFQHFLLSVAISSFSHQQGHVTCWNFNQTGPSWLALKSIVLGKGLVVTSREISSSTLLNLLPCPFLACTGSYSWTSLMRTPKGQSKVSILERCPYKRGHYDLVTHITPLTVLCVQ